MSDHSVDDAFVVKVTKTTGYIENQRDTFLVTTPVSVQVSGDVTIPQPGRDKVGFPLKSTPSIESKDVGVIQLSPNSKLPLESPDFNILSRSSSTFLIKYKSHVLLIQPSALPNVVPAPAVLGLNT